MENQKEYQQSTTNSALRDTTSDQQNPSEMMLPEENPTESNQFNLKEWEKSSYDPSQKLETAMKYLMALGEDGASYLEKSRIIMQSLHQQFQKEDARRLYLPWVRFLDISAHLQQDAFEGDYSLREEME